MTPPNPFIELARDPVATLGWLAYTVLVLAILLVGLSYTIRHGFHLYALATDRNTRQRDWWGETHDGWLPPTAWQLGALKVCIALSSALLAAASVVWLAG